MQTHRFFPQLSKYAFQSVGFNGVYVHLLVDNVKNFLDTYSSTDFAGFSCTIPHKESSLQCCDEVDPVAKSIGAVNCAIRRPNDGTLYGCNTDYVGAISAIEDSLRGSGVQNGATDYVGAISAIEDSLRGSGVQNAAIGSPLAGRLFVVIGAGGAGKALAYGAKAKGARIVIANQTYYRARELADIIGGEAIFLADLSTYIPEGSMILANTTSNGMQPNTDDTPISKEALKSYALVFDAVYTPKITRLLREAGEGGAVMVTGVEMFIGHAYEQYERFTGLPAPKELFREIMEKS